MKPGGFQWWAPHDRTTRDARRLFLLASGILAAYVVAVTVIFIGCLELADAAPAWLADWLDNLRVVGILLAVLVLHLCVATSIAVLGRGGLRRTTRKLVGVREPRGEECDAVIATVEAAAIGAGIPTPKVWVVDDPTPNALCFGGALHGEIGVTTGALKLPRDERDALCTCEVMMLAHRAFGYASAGADLVLVAHWCTTAAWSSAVLAFLSVLVGVPIDIAGATVLGLLLLTAVTSPLLAVSDRAVPRLLDDAAELADLETTRLTAQPSALAHLLLDLLERPARVLSRWEVAHLWFERDIVELGSAGRIPIPIVGAFIPLSVDSHVSTRRYARPAERSLARRAEVVVDLADGDAHLRGRLERACSAVEHS